MSAPRSWDTLPHATATPTKMNQFISRLLPEAPDAVAAFSSPDAQWLDRFAEGYDRDAEREDTEVRVMKRLER